MMNYVIGGALGVVVLLVCWPLIQKAIDSVTGKNPATPTTDPTAKAAEPTTDLKTKISAWLGSLGIVQKAEQLEGEVERITAFASVVLIQPHVVSVVDPTQVDAVNTHFNEILAAISTKPVNAPVADTKTKVV